MEFSSYTPNCLGFSPRFEIWCYKILKYPPKGQAINKKTDIKGFWQIFWLQNESTTNVSIVRRRGFRDRKVEHKKHGRRLRHW